MRRCGEAVASDVGIGPGGLTDGGRITSPAFAVNRCRDHGASQTTMCDFIPLRNKLISLGTHKISVLLVIDPTNDPVSRRYDQADILGIRHLSCPLVAGEECSLDCDAVIDRAVSRRLLPGLAWCAGDVLEDIWR